MEPALYKSFRSYFPLFNFLIPNLPEASGIGKLYLPAYKAGEIRLGDDTG
jgi:hypothetical protein